ELQAQGYDGGISILRDYIRPKRPLRASRATVRFETAPGHQLQHDWAELHTRIAGVRTKVYVAVNTLGYSRRFHFWAAPRKDAHHAFESLVRAFEYFGGVPREVLVDNEKTQVLSHLGGKAVFHPSFLDLAHHYGFTPKACRPYRARTKGKDERVVGYLKQHFFVRYREFESFAHLNQQAERWLGDEADRRVHGTTREVVIERFARELPHLQPLPPTRFDTSYRETRWVAWDGYIDVRGNRYSVPAHLCGHRVTVRIGLDDTLRVFAGDPEVLVATHRLRPATEGWGQIPDHHRALWQEALRVEQRDLSVYEEVAGCN
ncbi:IS21 family transposase, partial [Deferrisoma palaeochoriense]